jgi:GT2 family glycosyltransferase/2-polyprenyl-3-methyl-5-hydroxy-6-metoxy-1,4-benzoquinol methylase
VPERAEDAVTGPGSGGAEEPRYDIEVDMSNKNTSQTQIVLLTGRDKRVLEVGPATGYVAKALRDRGCSITGIELDRDAAEIASQFCERMIVADVEDLDFDELFGDTRFDVVVYGDVLEHLVDPETVLRRTARTLGLGGSVVASIPNVTHGSVRLSLMAGQFRYTDTGLLDRTHLRFYDRRGVEELFETGGFAIREWRRVQLDVFQPPEVELKEDDFSPELIRSIRTAPEAFTYQYVVRAEPVRVPESVPPPRRTAEIHQIAGVASSVAEERIESLEGQLAERGARLEQVETQYQRVVSSVAFRGVERFRRFVSRLAPWGTRRRSLILAPARALRMLGTEGLGALLRHALKVWVWVPRLFRPALPKITTSDERYELWLYLHVLSPPRLRAKRRQLRRLGYRPKISIVMPVYNTDPGWLGGAIDSVLLQLYPNWELCIADDASTRADTRELLRRFQAQDERIKVVELEENRGIAGASNAAFELATGEFVGLLDHDDELKPNALFEVVRLLNQQRDLDYVYSDEDKKELDGRLTEAFFKPGWSPDLLMSVNYVTHFSVYRRSVLEEVGGFRLGYDGSQDYDLVLRVTELTDRIAHIPLPLYSWRKVPGSAAVRLSDKDYAYDAGRRALADALKRRGYSGRVDEALVNGRYRVRYDIRDQPKVLVVIPTRDRVDLLRVCVESIRRRTSYPNYEIMIVDNQSSDPATLEYFEAFDGRVFPYPHEFNYARMMNVAAGEVGEADFVVFMNNDTEVISAEWIEAMVEHGQRPEVAMVGARLLFPDGRPQHEGIAIGLGGVASNLDHGGQHYGYFDLGETVRNCSAVTGACMLMRPEMFLELGGFEERLRVAFNDVDLCLRAREKGFLIVYTPHALLYHEESSSRGKLHPEEDERFFCQRWGWPSELRDEYYNVNLSRRLPFRLELDV